MRKNSVFQTHDTGDSQTNWLQDVDRKKIKYRGTEIEANAGMMFYWRQGTDD